MNETTKTLFQMKKASKLARLAMRKNGPKSYTRGQGALLRALLENNGATQRDLVPVLGVSRGLLKDIVLKARRNGLVTIEKTKEEHTYTITLTAEGRKLAEKREAANDEAAASILSALTDDEIAQLDAITEKLILSMKDAGICGKGKGRKEHRHHCHAHCRH